MKPARPAPPQVLAGQVRQARRRYRSRLERCRRGFAEPAVHELRIAVRRLLAVVDLLIVLCPSPRLGRIRRQLKRRLELFSPLRDLQVQRQLLSPLRKRVAAARTLRAWLHERERTYIAGLRRKIKALRPGRVNRTLKIVERELGELQPADVPEFLRCLAECLHRDFAGATRNHRKLRADRPATIHRLRVAFKQYRYLCELLQPLRPWIKVPAARAMPRFQARMGAIQDCEVMLDSITEAGISGVLAPAGAAALRRHFLRQRRRGIKSFLDKADQLRNFQPPPLGRERPS